MVNRFRKYVRTQHTCALAKEEINVALQYLPSISIFGFYCLYSIKYVCLCVYVKYLQMDGYFARN